MYQMVANLDALISALNLNLSFEQVLSNVNSPTVRASSTTPFPSGMLSN